MDGASLIVGLGNPGPEYAQTRHNMGFQVVECLAGRWGAVWKNVGKFKGRLARIERPRGRVWLCQPQTYMNLSGVTVRAVLDYYQVPLNGLLVVVDDADLPLGEIRLRPCGGSGGHHGLESVAAHLGTRDYARLRVGIGRRAGAERHLTGHVLGAFAAEETAVAGQAIARAASQAECWLDAGIVEAMNKFNGAVESPGSERECK